MQKCPGCSSPLIQSQDHEDRLQCPDPQCPVHEVSRDGTLRDIRGNEMFVFSI